MNSEKVVAVSVSSVVVMVMLMVVLWALIDYRAQVACLERGYPEHELTLSVVYCVKRVNQTDVVTPLHEIR